MVGPIHRSPRRCDANRRLLAGVALLVVVGPAGAQQLDRSQRPTVPPPAPFKFPKVERRTLANGIPVAIVENHELPIVAFRAVIAGGSRMDPVGKEGVSQLLTTMLREGTKTMTADQLAEAFADLGNIVTPAGFTTVTRNVPRSLELLSDMLMRPSLPQAALDRQKANLVANVQRAKEQPAALANRILGRVLYGAGHPYERAVSEQSVANITRDDLVAFHTQFLRPENVKLVVAGAVQADSIMTQLERTFGAWQPGGTKAPADVPIPKSVATTTIYIYDRPSSPQSTILFGRIGPTRSTPDFFALEAVSTVLGALSSSRLNQNLRERRAFTFAARDTIQWRRAPEPSTFTGSADVVAAKTDSALVVWMEELRAIRESRPPTDDEMEFARTNRVAGLPRQFESIDGLATRVALLLDNNLPFDFYEQYINRFSRLTAADAAAAAKRHIDPDHIAIVIVGDRRLIEPSLRAANIAPIVIVDELGNTR
jgi:zinc protease